MCEEGKPCPETDGDEPISSAKVTWQDGSGDVPAGEHDQKKAGRAAQIEMTLRGRFGEAVKGDEKAFEYISQAVLHMSSAEDRLILMAVAQNMFTFGAESYANWSNNPKNIDNALKEAGPLVEKLLKAIGATGRKGRFDVSEKSTQH